jgi:hypothetical protein
VVWVSGGRLQGELDTGQIDADVLHYALEPLQDTPLMVLHVKLGVVAHALHRGRHHGLYPA